MQLTEGDAAALRRSRQYIVFLKCSYAFHTPCAQFICTRRDRVHNAQRKPIRTPVGMLLSRLRHATRRMMLTSNDVPGSESCQGEQVLTSHEDWQ